MAKDKFFDLEFDEIEIPKEDIIIDDELKTIDYEHEEFEEDNYNEELDEFEEEEPQPFMIAIIGLGVVIAFLVVICVMFLFLKGRKEDEQLKVASIETETELVTEELPENESMEIESQTDVIVVTSEADTLEERTNTVESVQTEELETESEQTTTLDADVEETSPSEEVVVFDEPVSGNESMEFMEVSDTVTAKDVTNLRTLPSTTDETNIIAQLKNGDVLARTGMNEAYGWSRLDYNGQTVYAVSNYLTTDLNYKTPVAPSDPNRVSTQDGRVIIFTDYSDNITPKEYVNLRTEPSTSQGESTVRCQIKNGDVVHRTGYSPDSGWSRVEYNGEVLYVVSSMVYTVE